MSVFESKGVKVTRPIVRYRRILVCVFLVFSLAVFAGCIVFRSKYRPCRDGNNRRIPDCFVGNDYITCNEDLDSVYFGYGINGTCYPGRIFVMNLLHSNVTAPIIVFIPFLVHTLLTFAFYSRTKDNIKIKSSVFNSWLKRFGFIAFAITYRFYFVYLALDERIIEPIFRSFGAGKTFDISDHLPLYALLVLVTGLELAVASNKVVDDSNRYRIFGHDIIFSGVVCFSIFWISCISYYSFKTAALFHTPTETITALVIVIVFMLAPMISYVYADDVKIH